MDVVQIDIDVCELKLLEEAGPWKSIGCEITTVVMPDPALAQINLEQVYVVTPLAVIVMSTHRADDPKSKRMIEPKRCVVVGPNVQKKLTQSRS